MRKNEEMEMSNPSVPSWNHYWSVRRAFLLHSQADLMMYESCCFTPYNVWPPSLLPADWLDASWCHHSAAAGAGHRDQTGEGHHQCRANRCGPQWAGGLLLRLHRQMAALAHHQQVRICCCWLIFFLFMCFMVLRFLNVQDTLACICTCKHKVFNN